MATIPRGYVDALTQSLNMLSAATQAVARRQLEAIEYTDIADLRRQVAAILNPLLAAATDYAAAYSAETYDQVREYSVGEANGAVAYSGRVPEATEGAVRALVGKVEGLGFESFVSAMLDRCDYEIKKAAGDCTLYNAERDPLKPRFARVPTGFETCTFCIMLASRGFVYRSAESAGAFNHWHPHCDCRVIQGYPGMKVEGYDPDELYRQWKEARSNRKGKVQTGSAPDTTPAQPKPKKAFSFTPAKTTKEAEAFARETFGCEVSFKGLCVEAANALNESIARHLDRFPELQGNLGFIGSAQECNRRRKKLWADYYLEKNRDLWSQFGLSETAMRKRAERLAGRTVGRSGDEWAWSYSPPPTAADYSCRGICMNQKHWKTSELYQQQLVDLQRGVDTKFHPQGTEGVASIFDHEVGHQLDAMLGISTNDEFKEFRRQFSRDAVIDRLSKYATKNDKEFVAEAWSEYLNNPEPRPIATYIGQMIERRYNYESSRQRTSND